MAPKSASIFLENHRKRAHFGHAGSPHGYVGAVMHPRGSADENESAPHVCQGDRDFDTSSGA
jgi:hypothetical protein